MVLSRDFVPDAIPHLAKLVARDHLLSRGLLQQERSPLIEGLQEKPLPLVSLSPAFLRDGRKEGGIARDAQLRQCPA